MSNSIKLVVDNIRKFDRELERSFVKRRNAAITATKVEGFKLKNKLQAEIRQGEAGGQAFSPLSEIAKRFRPNRKPLTRLAVAVRYAADNIGKQATIRIGFGGPGRARVSKSWIRIAGLNQDGGKLPLGEFDRNKTFDGMSLRTKLVLMAVAAKRFGRGTGTAGKFLFPKKSTTHVQLPKREIIEPFWRANQVTAASNIIKNFELKLSGERI